MRPLVSVIVPAYNASNSIDKCLESLLNQTLNNIEIIVINDHSSDDTLKKIKSKKDKRIVLIDNKKNLGPAASRNKGMKIARGEFIGFVDSDDYVDTNMYKTMVEYMTDDIDLVCCSRYNVTKYEIKPIININKTTNPRDFSKTSNYNVDKLFRKSIIEEYDLKQPEEYKYAEDFAFNIRYKYYARKMVILENPFYYYIYDSSGSITNTYNSNILGIVDVLRDVMNFFKKENVFEEYYDELFNVSKGYYYRRVREFNRFKNIKLKTKYIDNFFSYFNEYFPNYKEDLLEFNGKKYRKYYSSRLLMKLYVIVKQIGR